MHERRLSDMDFFSEDVQPRCAEPDVDPNWWYDLDVDREGMAPPPENLDKLEKARWRRRQVEPNLIKQREAQTRAVLYCLECPLMMACRKAGWQEGVHVWGGLTATERFKILTTGDVTSVIRPTAPFKVSVDRDNEIVQAFMEGAGYDDLVEELGLSTIYVQELLRAALTKLRVEREDEERWSTQWALPQLPSGLGRTAYRNGRAVWSLLEEESA